MSGGQLNDSWEPVAWPESSLADGSALRDLLVRAARKAFQRVWPRHDTGDGVGRGAVGFADPACVDPECRSAAAPVTKAAGDSSHVHVRGDEFCRRIVAQSVQPGAAQS